MNIFIFFTFQDKYDQILAKLKSIQGRRPDQLSKDLKKLEAVVNNQADQMETSLTGVTKLLGAETVQSPSHE